MAQIDAMQPASEELPINRLLEALPDNERQIMCPALEAAVCDCYRAITQQFTRLAGQEG